MKDQQQARAGEWDFEGACAPFEGSSQTTYDGQISFTLGCFQWAHRKDGRGLKKGKVQYRIKGHVCDSADAYRRAREFCAKKNAQAASATP